MTLVFDLDHTLFDTVSFKEDLFRIFEESGASRDVVESAYEEHLKQVAGSYDFELHSEVLEKRCEAFDKRLASEKFLVFEKSDYRKYVSQEAFQVLGALKDRRLRLILLTRGSEKMQMQKIERSGLGVFFDKVMICQGDKSDALAELRLDTGDCFINDHWGETKILKEDFPRPRYFLLKRPDLEKYHSLFEIDIPILLSLKELLKVEEIKLP